MTLDSDTRGLVQRAIRNGGGSFEQALNAPIRHGLPGMRDMEAHWPSVVEPRVLRLRVHEARMLRELDEEHEAERFTRSTRSQEPDDE